MKKNLLILISFISITSFTKLYDLDKTLAIIYSEEGASVVVTESDLHKKDINGQLKNLGEIIFEHLIYFETKKYKIDIDDEQINSFITNIQKQNNISIEELKQVFIASGYTFEEGKEELRKMKATNIFLDNKIRTRLIVTEDAIQNYYDKHPIVKEKSYVIKKAFIPFTEKTDKEKLKKDIKVFLKTKKGISVTWKAPITLEDKQLSEKMAILRKLKLGQIYLKSETKSGFELLKLIKINKKEVAPLESRKKEIISILKKEKFEKLYSALREELFKKAAIKYFE